MIVVRLLGSEVLCGNKFGAEVGKLLERNLMWLCEKENGGWYGIGVVVVSEVNGV